MENFAHTYNVIWSIGAICIGLIGLFFRSWFLKFCEKMYMSLYRKTNFSLFERGAKEFTKPYMRMLVIFLGLVFLIVGLLILLGVM